MTSFSSVQYTYCISSASERKEIWNCMHFLVILSLKTLWAGVKHWRTALHRFYVYRKPISSPRSCNTDTCFIQKIYAPSSLGVSQFESDPHSHFHCHACILSLSPLFSHDLWLGYFFYSRDPRFKSLIDSPWFVKFSKMTNFNFRETWFGFDLFSDIRDTTTPLF